MNKPVAPATPALDPVTVAPCSGSGYPAPYRDEVDYPGIDLRLLHRNGRDFFGHKDGTPW
jgi:hypothetical protein